MKREEQYQIWDERIDRYLRNKMEDDERTAFEQEVDGDKELRERLVATALLVKGISQEGMRREGQAQLDTIKKMSKEEFIGAFQGKKSRKPMWTFAKWASGIAAIAILALCIPLFFHSNNTQNSQMAKTAPQKTVKPKVPKSFAKPTLASLADEYNKPFGGEPDGFVSIREQIQKGGSKDMMMAVVYDIEKIESPTAKHGPKGASDEDEVKETVNNYRDCTHWYKALAFLKAGNKESAIRELTELKEHGKVDELVNRATTLLTKLEK